MSDKFSTVIVPGVGNSGPDHWQTYLQSELSNTSRVEQTLWDLPIRYQWVNALERHVRNLAGPLVLVGHSAGALTIVEWANRAGTTGKIKGAILVAPPDMEDTTLDMPPRWIRRVLGWVPISRQQLPFPSILVSSNNDPMGTEVRLHDLARHWGSDVLSLKEAGHINVDAGYGEWPEAKNIIRSLVSGGQQK